MKCSYLLQLSFSLASYLFVNAWETYYNQWPASINTVFIVKFLLEAKMKNGVFPDISNLSVCQNSIF